MGSVKKSLGEDTAISALDINLFDASIVFDGIKIKDSKLLKYQNSIGADRIKFSFDMPSTLLKREVSLRSVYLKNLKFECSNNASEKTGTSQGIEESNSSVPAQGEGAQAAYERGESKIGKSKKPLILSKIHVDKIIVDNAELSFADFSPQESPNIIEIKNINGEISRLLISSDYGGHCEGAVSLKGYFDSLDEGQIKLEGPFAVDKRGVDFDFIANLNNIDLVRFKPYYSKTSFTIIKEARLDILSRANCVKDNLKAYQDAHIYDIVFNDIKPDQDDLLFGLPASTVTEFFKDSKYDIDFDFNITGTISDPKFEPGEIIQQILSKALQDKIISKIQRWPNEMIEMGEKVINEHFIDGNKIRVPERSEADKILDDLGEGLKKMIKPKP